MTDPRALLDEAASTVVYAFGPDDGRTYAERDPAPYAALRAVLGVHREGESHDGTRMAPNGTCVGCSEREDTYDDIPWPCATVRAITTALEAS